MKKKASIRTQQAKLLLGGAIGGGVILVFMLVFLCVPQRWGVVSLSTLQEAQAYALSMPELPKPSNTNLVRPDYASFYRAHRPGFFSKKWRALKALFGLHGSFVWSPSYFKSLLTSQLDRLKGYKVENDCVYKIMPKEGAKIIILGELSGAYHSLVRDLLKIKELNLIDDNMRLKDASVYLVILGSAISRSAYGMETLGILLHLMEMNYDNVIYLRGNHEDNRYWEAFGLKEEYEAYFDADAKDMVNYTNDLFMHLPLGLYVSIASAKDHFVRISHLAGSESSKLKEETYAHFLEAEQQGAVDRHQIDKEVVHTDVIHVDASVHSEVKRQTFQVSHGLRQMPSDGGAIAWTLMSGPTYVNQKGLKFSDDSFAVLKVAAKRADWVVTDYWQDANKKDGFTMDAYQFFTGRKASEKIDIPEVAAPEAAAEKTAPEKIESETATAEKVSEKAPEKKEESVKEEPKPQAPEKAAPFVEMLAGNKLS